MQHDAAGPPVCPAFGRPPHEDAGPPHEDAGVLFWLRIAQGEDGVGEGRIADGTAAAQDRPPAEEVFAERVARLVERWRAQLGTGRWPPVPLAGLGRDDPRRVAAEITEELLRARGHLLAAAERVRSAAALRRRLREEPGGEPDP